MFEIYFYTKIKILKNRQMIKKGGKTINDIAPFYLLFKMQNLNFEWNLQLSSVSEFHVKHSYPD